MSIISGGVLVLGGQSSPSGTLSSGQINVLGGQTTSTSVPFNSPSSGLTLQNQAPTPQQDSASVYEFGTIDNIDVLSNDSDPDGDNLTIISAMASNGSAYVNEFNTINYTAGSAGIDTITYTVQDVFGNTAQSFVIVDVLGNTGGGGGGGDNGGGGVSNPPVANDDQATTDEVTPITVDVITNDTDIDGDTLYLVPDSVHVEQGQATVRVNGNSIEVIPISAVGEQEIVIYYAVADAPHILAANITNARYATHCQL
jgi:hypothetical protein